MTSLPMCGFIAQLVEHRTGIAEVTGSNSVEVLIFSGFFFPTVGKLTAMIILHFHLQPQFKYELFHIYFTLTLSDVILLNFILFYISILMFILLFLFQDIDSISENVLLHVSRFKILSVGFI